MEAHAGASSSGNRFMVLGEKEQIEKSPGKKSKEAPPTEIETQEKTCPETQKHQTNQLGHEKEKGKEKATEEQEENPYVEPGEVSTDSDSTDASGPIATPKKAGRGRKSKKEEREKETYKEVLNGSHKMIKQLMDVRKTRNKDKAHQGANNPPPPPPLWQVNHETSLLEL
jgi:hypothetical protein